MDVERKSMAFIFKPNPTQNEEEGGLVIPLDSGTTYYLLYMYTLTMSY